MRSVISRLSRPLLITGLVFPLAACEQMMQNSAFRDSHHAPNATTAQNQSAPASASRSRAAVEQDRDLFNGAATDLQAGIDQLNQTDPRANDAQPVDPTPTRRTPGRPSASQDQSKPNQRDAGALANRSASVPDTSIGHAGSKDDRSPERRRADAVAELATQLKPGIDGASQPLKAAMPLIGLETISTGAAAADLAAIDKAVTSDQRKTIGAVNGLIRALATDPNLTTADPQAVARMLRDRAAMIDDSTEGAGPSGDALALGTVELCQRVDGFGRYHTLGSNAFIAGRANALILYGEVQNFAQTRTEASRTQGSDATDSWGVELGQTVRLFFDADNSEQLAIPETMVRDTSHSRRKDFFLVQRIDLPRNLSVGDYNLKVTVRDAGIGGGGAMVEKIVPIRIVADPSAAGSADRRVKPTPVPERQPPSKPRQVGASR